MRKITEGQRIEILKVYGERGHKAAAKLCREYGVSENYPCSLASAYGITTPRSRGEYRKYRDRKVNVPGLRDWKDPRWAWAIERGPVLA